MYTIKIIRHLGSSFCRT